MLLTKRDRMPGGRSEGLYGTSVALMAEDCWGAAIERFSLITFWCKYESFEPVFPHFGGRGSRPNVTFSLDTATVGPVQA